MILIGPFGGRFFWCRFLASGGAPLQMLLARDRIGCGGCKAVKSIGESDRFFQLATG